MCIMEITQWKLYSTFRPSGYTLIHHSTLQSSCSHLSPIPFGLSMNLFQDMEEYLFIHMFSHIIWKAHIFCVLWHAKLKSCYHSNNYIHYCSEYTSQKTFAINGQTTVVKTIVYHFIQSNVIVLDSINYCFYMTSTQYMSNSLMVSVSKILYEKV